MTKAALEGSGLDNKAMLKCRNIFALGLVCWLFDRPLESAERFIRNKFAKKPAVADANIKVLHAGYDYGHNIQRFPYPPTASKPKTRAPASTPTSTATQPQHGA